MDHAIQHRSDYREHERGPSDTHTLHIALLPLRAPALAEQDRILVAFAGIGVIPITNPVETDIVLVDD